MKSKFFWLIRSKEKQKYFFEYRYLYSASRTAPKNKRHLTGTSYKVRIFSSKNLAYSYFYKKLNSGVSMEDCAVVKKKLFIDEKGYLAYWENLRVLK